MLMRHVTCKNELSRTRMQVLGLRDTADFTAQNYGWWRSPRSLRLSGMCIPKSKYLNLNTYTLIPKPQTLSTVRGTRCSTSSLHLPGMYMYVQNIYLNLRAYTLKSKPQPIPSSGIPGMYFVFCICKIPECLNPSIWIYKNKKKILKRICIDM